MTLMSLLQRTRLTSVAKRSLPPLAYTLLYVLKSWPISRNLEDFQAYIGFLLDRNVRLSIREKLRIIEQLYAVSLSINSPHTHAEALAYMRAVWAIPASTKGVLVEAGCFKGSSTAKISLAAKLAGRELIVFDSFQGLPKTEEPHTKNIFGGVALLKEGDYCEPLDRVKANVAKYGEVECCRFVPGWFEDTMPKFKEPVAAAFLDIDLAASTRTCLKYLYPLLQPGGVLFSQDAHLPLVIEVLDDDEFWMKEMGVKKPHVEGLRKKKLIRIVKQANDSMNSGGPVAVPLD